MQSAVARYRGIGVLVLAIAYTQAITGRLWQFGRVIRNINKALGDAADMTEIGVAQDFPHFPKEPEGFLQDGWGPFVCRER